MLDQAMKVMLLLKGLERKVDQAKADGVISFDEKKALVVGLLAGIVDIAQSLFPDEVVDAALEDVQAVRDRISLYRTKSAVILDELKDSADEVLS